MISEDPIQITFPVLKMQQPIGPFYIGAISARDLFKICYFDIRRIPNEGDLDAYMGIQRELNSSRVKEISDYVETRDATFPTAVILAVDQDCALLTPAISTLVEDTGTTSEELEDDAQDFTEERAQDDGEADEPVPALDDARFLMMTLRNLPDPPEGKKPILFRQIARVLDGQHRIAGLEGYEGPDFEINVAIFVGLDIATQAGIFSVVNLAQTKVNRSLVYDLYAYDEARFPEKTCHDIAVALDKAESSPLNGMIKRLGVSTAGRFGQTLSQATFVDGLLPYISTQIIKDRDIGRRGLTWPRPTDAELQKMIFRGLFIAEQDFEIARILTNYFDAVKQRWPDAWRWTGAGRILNKTTGYNALMRFLRPAYLHFTQPSGTVSTQQFLSLFALSSLQSDDFNTERFKPGSSGSSQLYNMLLEESGLMPQNQHDLL